MDRRADPDLGGAHVEFRSRVRNPVAVKVGPTVARRTLLALVKALDPEGEPGRLTLITRMGAGRIREALPPLVSAVAGTGLRGVGVRPDARQHGLDGERPQDPVLRPRAGRGGGLLRGPPRALGTHPGGIHVEFTGDDVTECIGGGHQIAEADLRQRYETACDPRLNRGQSLDLAFRVADLYRLNR